MDFGDAGQGTYVLAVLLNYSLKVLYVTGQEFQAEGQRLMPLRKPLQPFVDTHDSIVAVSCRGFVNLDVPRIYPFRYGFR